MRLLYVGKDGGYYSTVWGYWLCEFKRLFSIVLLRFEDGSRDAYHSHAFNCVSWVLKGKLREDHFAGMCVPPHRTEYHTPSWRPVITRRDTFHRVVSEGRTWVLSFRGPWSKEWREYLPRENRYVTLTHGRRAVVE